MVLTIDFKDMVIFLQGYTIEDTKRLPAIIEASGYDSKDFTIQCYDGGETDSTEEVGNIIFEINKDDIN